MKKQTGIWVDLRHALIINLPSQQQEGEAVVQKLFSDIDETSPSGGSRTATPWGPQGGDPKPGAQERRHHEESQYFSEIIDALDTDIEELVIFGPSESKEGLANALAKKHDLKAEVKGVETANKMTDNQLIAWVREYFGRPAPRRLPK